MMNSFCRHKAVIWPRKDALYIVKEEKTRFYRTNMRQYLQYDYTPAQRRAGDGRVLLALADCIDVYGLTDYGIYIIIGDERLVMRTVSLPTRSRKEAKRSVAWSGIMLDSGDDYLFDARCVKKDAGSNEYEWLAAAYPRDFIAALHACCVKKGVTLLAVDVLPAAVRDFCSAYEGAVFIDDGAFRHTVVLKPCSVEAYACEEKKNGDNADAADSLQAHGDSKWLQKAAYAGCSGTAALLVTGLYARHMRFNLLEKEETEEIGKRTLKKYAPAVEIILIGACVLTAIAGQVTERVLQREYTAYCAGGRAVAERTAAANGKEREAERAAKELKRRLDGRTHITSLLVALGGTKPAGIEVESLSCTRNVFTVTAKTESKEDIAAWQGKLTKAMDKARVDVRRVEGKEKAARFELTVEINGDMHQ